MHPFSLLIKPTSADCNLKCDYCFYLDHSSFYSESDIHRMSDTVLETMIRKYMYTQQSQYMFAWQGGEPTLMGYEFFKKIVFWQQKYGTPGANVGNGLQTNGTMIDDDMARLFSEYKFLLGVSLDGPEEIHNQFRKNRGGQGSHHLVLNGIERLIQNQVEFNILTLVSQSNAHRAEEVYSYLRRNEFYYHQYIPCVEFDDEGQLLPFAVSGGEWGQFLCDLFDLWYPSDTRKVSIRLFDCVLNYLVDGQYTVCHMGSNCCQYFVVEYNGDIFPCDFFVTKDLELGNIIDNSWEQALQSPLYRDFGRQKHHWNKACESCEFLPYCSGDCMKHRPGLNLNPETLSILCEGWKKFYNYTLDRFKTLANEIREDRNQYPSGVSRPESAQLKRNDPCYCGSGRKFKFCCGKI